MTPLATFIAAIGIIIVGLAMIGCIGAALIHAARSQFDVDPTGRENVDEG